MKNTFSIIIKKFPRNFLLVISHKCRLISWLFLAQGPICTFFVKPFLTLATKSLILPSFTALAVLFPDYQNLTYVKTTESSAPLECNKGLFLDVNPKRHFLDIQKIPKATKLKKCLPKKIPE